MNNVSNKDLTAKQREDIIQAFVNMLRGDIEDNAHIKNTKTICTRKRISVKSEPTLEEITIKMLRGK